MKSIVLRGYGKQHLGGGEGGGRGVVIWIMENFKSYIFIYLSYVHFSIGI